MTCPSEIMHRLDEALGNEPFAALVAVRRLANEDLSWLEERAVRMARADGYSWAQLGRLLLRSRQAVRKRFGAIDGSVQPLPHPTVRDDLLVIERWNRAKAETLRRREFAASDPQDIVPW